MYLCPMCGAELKRVQHPFDRKMQFYLVLPTSLLAFAVILKLDWLFYVFFFFTIIIAFLIVRKFVDPEYKNWKVWRLHDE